MTSHIMKPFMLEPFFAFFISFPPFPLTNKRLSKTIKTIKLERRW